MYWACARTEVRREAVAERYLTLNGYRTYLPRLSQHRVSHGRRIETRPPLFPNYLFFAIEGGWHSARWSVGVVGLIMDGERPARVADAIVDEIKSREGRHGLVELPRRELARVGDPVRVLRGAFQGQVGLYAGMAAHERVTVLLSLLGGQRRVILPGSDVAAAF